MDNKRVALGEKYSNICSKLKGGENSTENNKVTKVVRCTSIENTFSKSQRKRLVRNNDVYEQVMKEVSATYYKK